MSISRRYFRKEHNWIQSRNLYINDHSLKISHQVESNRLNIVRKIADGISENYTITLVPSYNFNKLGSSN